MAISTSPMRPPPSLARQAASSFDSKPPGAVHVTHARSGLSSLATASDGASAQEALEWLAVMVRNPRITLADLPQRPSAAAWRAVGVASFRAASDDALLSRRADVALDALERLGALDVWLPEVASLVGFGFGDVQHKDVWRHTKIVVRQAVPRLAVRWGALFHDVGKPRTRSIDTRGKVHFHGHAEVGAAMFRKRIANRLGFAGELGARIDFLIYQHQRISHYDGSWTDNAVRRFYRDVDGGLDDLLALSRADITTKHRDKRRRALYQIAELAKRIRALRAEDARPKALPKGLGLVLSDALGIPPSRALGIAMKRLQSAVDTGELAAGAEASVYVEWLRAHPQA